MDELMMEVLEWIIAKSRQESKDMTTTKSKEYKCHLCKYTGFILEYREHLNHLIRNVLVRLI
ncbi:hypothetical protein [Clostridium perfringens]|uniref:hypothetical protein n=1 Tax=Clostridium perfringens TaxID=1502 RepID=UPI0018E44B3D|nr:hypothetical protein [Clostridium perfringens]MBI6039191.1 hypothetical protein [Clostridium perfringens]MDM0491098.1 hypothetical protein [Clostridium perfringens]